MHQVRLISLEMKNFRNYHDAVIMFSCDPQKMFTVLSGPNGVGKTNILNAITWCLYGTERSRYYDDDIPINFRALTDKPNQTTMYVQLTLDDNGKKTRIKREFYLEPEKPTPRISTIFQRYDDSAGWESVEDIDRNVNELLPESLAWCFLPDLEDYELDYRKNTEHMTEDMIVDIQKQTREYFLKLSPRRPDSFGNVIIDGSGKISLLDCSNQKCMRLAATQAHILALSFIAALYKIAGFNFPIMLDSVFGRMYGEYRHNVTSHLSDILNTQVILLLSDAEYKSSLLDETKNFPSVQDTIKDRVGKEYEIMLVDNHPESVIKLKN